MRLLAVLLALALCMVNVFAACNQPYTRVEEPKDRIGVIVLCPYCGEDTICRYYNNNKVVYDECNEGNYYKEYANEQAY